MDAIAILGLENQGTVIPIPLSQVLIMPLPENMRLNTMEYATPAETQDIKYPEAKNERRKFIRFSNKATERDKVIDSGIYTSMKYIVFLKAIQNKGS